MKEVEAQIFIRPQIIKVLLSELEYHRVPTKNDDLMFSIRKKLKKTEGIVSLTREEYEKILFILSHMVPTPDAEGRTIEDWFNENV